MRSETMLSLFVKEAVDVVNCLLNVLAALLSKKEPQVYLNRRLYGPQIRTECCCGEDGSLFLMPAIEPRLTEGQPIT